MDNNLKIRVDVQDEQLQGLVDKFNDGAITVGEFKTMVKGFNEEMQKVALGSDAQRQLMQATLEAKSVQSQMTQEIKGTSGAFSEYRANMTQARQEHRLVAFAALELTHGFEGVATALALVTGGSDESVKSMQKTTQGITSAVAAAMGLKFGLDMMGSSFAAFSGPAAIVLGALTLFGTMISAENDQIKANTNAFDENIKMRLKLGEITEQEYQKTLQRELDIAKRREEEAKNPGVFSTFTSALGQMFKGKFGVTDAAMGAAISQTTEIYNLDTKRLKIQDDLNASKKREADADTKKATEQKKTDDEHYKALVDRAQLLHDLGEGSESAVVAALEQQLFHEKDINAQLELRVKINEALLKQVQEEAPNARESFTPIGTGISRPLGPAITNNKMSVASISLENRSMVDSLSQVKATFVDAVVEQDVFHSSFMSGVTSIANAIGDKIGTAFSNLFGGAKTLLGNFAGQFMSTLASIASQVAVSGLLNSLIPGLGLLSGFKFFGNGGTVDEPVIGIGTTSHKGYMIGESGREHIVTDSQMSRLSSGSYKFNAGQVVSSGQSAKATPTHVDLVSALGSVLNNSQLVASGHDLVLVYKRASASRSGRVM